MRANNNPVRGSLLQEKAREFASLKGNKEFRASEGWLSNFKKRHGISMKIIQGKEGSVNMETVTNWRTTVLRDELEKFPPADVYNVDETGLFWKLLPNKTLAFKNQRCSGMKKAKDRLTILIGCNMDGSDKLPLLVIGKSAKPRCFSKAVIPVTYTANSKAWMTSAIFADYLKKLNNRFRGDNRHVVLFIDNCPALVASFDRNEEHKIDLLTALWTLFLSWNDIAANTILNCFRHAGFLHIQNDESDLENVEIDEYCQRQFEDLRLSELLQNVDIEEYLAIDDDVATSGVPSRADFYLKNQEGSFESEEDVGESHEETSQISFADAHQSLHVVLKFMKQNSNSNVVSKVDALIDEFEAIRIKRSRQTSIVDFFNVC